MKDETKTCKDCKREIEYLADFPGPRCLACHAAIWEKVPLSQMPRPNFVAAIRKLR